MNEYIPIGIETENGFIGGTGQHHKGWGGTVPRPWKPIIIGGWGGINKEYDI